ncbi:carbohydrate porin [Novosphingobium sediminicola]|uniref:Porin n=1 Tax=Novosphingobium sediminicola TaxID=563162 RepID=A0A7W6CJJ6_9SPHN|nr:carbohydrate porin [Novosphingobium sediminicola]MBB3955628.1 porin [Novosphingobium sediminicola]
MYRKMLKGACTAGVIALSLSLTLASNAMAQEAPIKPFQPLADEGITLALNYTGEAAGNVSGGLRRASAYTGQVYMGADFDMDRIAGIGGGTLHFAVTNRHGKSLSGIAIGNNTSVQEVWGTQNTHLAILTWEQKLLDGRVNIEAGRSQANIHFLNSPLYCNFQTNSACGNPTFVFKNSNFTYFPASSWMVHARANITPQWFVHVGAYEVNPDRKQGNDNGFSFSTRNATGVIVPWEAGYGDDAGKTRLPGHYILGGWFDRGDYADPLRDAHGGIAILTGQNAATLHGRSGLYFRFDQMLTRPDANSKRGLTLFGVAMANLSGRVEESHYLELGLLQTGTFKGRDADTLGFLINDQQFSDLAVERMRAARMAAGGDGNIHRHQYMMELAYGAQLNPAMRISPNIQYILHPDQTGAPFRTRDIGNALVFGLKFTVDAPTLIGMMR